MYGFGPTNNPSIRIGTSAFTAAWALVESKGYSLLMNSIDYKYLGELSLSVIAEEET
jgi:hypothetical protein